MPKLFVSYAHTDQDSVSRIASGLEQRGHDVWWDRRLMGGQDFGAEIESALVDAKCAVVAWSITARNSLWVRAEATVARESSKLVQLSLDGSKPPLPFNMLHLLDFSLWHGDPSEPTFVKLGDSVESVLRGEAVPLNNGQSTRGHLGGLGRATAVGGASLALVILAAGLVGLGSSGSFSADTFGLVSGGMLLIAMLAFVYMLTRVITIYLASQ